MKNLKECFTTSDAEGIFKILQDYAPSKSAERTEHGILADTIQTPYGEVNIHSIGKGIFYFENQKMSRSTKVDVTKESDLGKLTEFLSFQSPQAELSSTDLSVLKVASWERLRDVHEGLRPNYGEFDEDDVFFGPGIRPGMYD